MSSDATHSFEATEPEPIAADGSVVVDDVEALYAEIERLDAVVSELTDELSSREERIESLEAELRDKSRAALLATSTPTASLERVLVQRDSDLRAAVSALGAAREALERSERDKVERESQLRADNEAAHQMIAALKAQLASRSIDIATECDRAERAEQELTALRAELTATRETKRALERENSALTVQLCEAEERLSSDSRVPLDAAS